MLKNSSGIKSCPPPKCTQFVQKAFTDVRWGSNQNVVSEFVVREISMLLTLKASREIKNWYFTMKILPQNLLYDNKYVYRISRPKDLLEKDIRNLLTCVVGKCFSLLPNLTNFQKLNCFFFAMKFLEKKLLYVNNICSKFQGQKINTKKILTIYQHMSLVEKQLWKPFYYFNFDTLLRAEKFLIYYEIFVTKSFIC